MKVVTVVGARPQFIKASAVSRELARSSSLEEVLVHTGQHYDPLLSDVFFQELGLPAPALNLGVGSGLPGAQTGRMVEGIEAVLTKERPACVLLYGDTNSTLAGAIAAAKAGIPIAHVEAGLRSYNRAMPEEHNRVLTDHVSTWLYCPSNVSRDNLRREGIVEGVQVVGDVMRDVLERVAKTAPAPTGPAYAVATLHRAQTTDDPAKLASVLKGLAEVAADGIRVVLPLHPRSRKAMQAQGLAAPGIDVVDPMPYGDLVRALQGARLVLTDSGGLQKEADWLGRPCVTLRDETEWTETVAEGWNTLAGTDARRIAAAARAARPGRGARDAYGDAGASRRIVAHLETALRP